MSPRDVWAGTKGAGEARGGSRPVVNVVTNWGSFVVSIGITLALSPFIVHTLGNTAYGVWVLLTSLVSYLGLLDLGTRGAVTKYVATYHASRRHEDAGRLASAALSLFGALGLLATAASAVLALVLDRVAEIPVELVSGARIAVFVSGVNIAVSLVGGVFGGIVVGRQRFDSLNGLNVGLAVLRAGAIVLTLRGGGGLVGLALVQLGISTLQTGATVWLSRRVYPALRLSLASWRYAHLRTVLAFGVWSSLLHVSGAVLNYSDAVVIGALLPVAEITFFAIAAGMTDQCRAVIAGISQTLTPMAGALEARRGTVRDVLMRGTRFAALAILPIIATFELRGTSFIRLWMGPEYAVPAGSVLMVLGIGLWPFAGYQVLTATMMGINRHRGLVPLFFAEAVANVLLSIVLVRRFGIVGAAWGTTLPRLIVSLIAGPLYARRELGVSVAAYWETMLLRPGLAVLPFALATGMVEAWFPAANIVVFFGQVAGILPVAAIGTWVAALTPEERRVCAAAVRGWRPSRGDALTEVAQEQPRAASPSASDATPTRGCCVGSRSSPTLE
jgi:O-antigen/teichoic acid export membrane protein